MLTDFFKNLFDYNFNTNQRLINSFQEQQGAHSDQAVKLFSHVLNAHQIWNYRILGLQSSPGVWDIHPIEHFDRLDQQNRNDSFHILDNFELSLIIQYSNSKGQAFSNELSDILYHILNHSTYHRGQIATQARQSGLQPVNTDYIFYKR